jgi:hypothetical protein
MSKLEETLFLKEFDDYFNDLKQFFNVNTSNNTFCKSITINGQEYHYCSYIKESNKKTRKLDIKKIKGQDMAKWGDKWYPVCDGWGFPYVEGCYQDMSNWTPGTKQCIITNPGTSNLKSGSLYTCGFLW